MKEPIDYKILSALNTDPLVCKVEDAIKEGWKPTGGLTAITKRDYTPGGSKWIEIFFQAMTRTYADKMTEWDKNEIPGL